MEDYRRVPFKGSLKIHRVYEPKVLSSLQLNISGVIAGWTKKLH